MVEKLVSIITATHRRTKLLWRAVESVKRQDYPNIEHLIVGDAHPDLDKLKNDIAELNPQARVVNLNTSPEVVYPAARVSIARNHGINMARGEYIAYLDDDNEIEPNHISSLVTTLENEQGAEAAHSWRKLFIDSGVPFIVTAYPWAIAPNLRKYVFDLFVQAGIFIPGTNEVRDQMVTPSGDPILHVDTSEWLIRKNLHARIKFDIQYTIRQMIQNQTEDFLMATAFSSAGIKVVCSRQATLLYYLGGYSNESRR